MFMAKAPQMIAIRHVQSAAKGKSEVNTSSHLLAELAAIPPEQQSKLEIPLQLQRSTAEDISLHVFCRVIIYVKSTPQENDDNRKNEGGRRSINDDRKHQFTRCGKHTTGDLIGVHSFNSASGRG